jgi:hypothetical protein
VEKLIGYKQKKLGSYGSFLIVFIKLLERFSILVIDGCGKFMSKKQKELERYGNFLREYGNFLEWPRKRNSCLNRFLSEPVRTTTRFLQVWLTTFRNFFGFLQKEHPLTTRNSLEETVVTVPVFSGCAYDI